MSALERSEAGVSGGTTGDELNRLRSHVAALEELLQAHERAVREQASKLENALDAYRRLIEAVPDAILVFGGDGNIRQVNSRAESLFGGSREELLGQPVYSMVEEDSRGRFLELRRRYLSGPLDSAGIAEAEIVMRRRDGSKFPVEVSMNASRSEEGPLLIGVFRDISERKRAESALRTSEERTRRIIETAHDAFIGMDSSGRITDWNQQAEETFGWSRAEAIGSPLAEMIIPDRHREAHHRGLERFLTTGEGPYLNRRFEITALHRSGREFPVELRISPIRWGSSYIFSAFVHDITLRKQAEEELRKLARELARSNQALEEFAYAASHDLQEPLRKVLAFGERLEAKCGEALTVEGRDYLQRMRGAAARMQALIQGLLAFSRVTMKAEPFAAVDLGEVAREVLQDLEVRIEQTGARISVGALPSIEADRTQMRQLIQNLVSNALKFRRPEAPPVVKIHGEVVPGRIPPDAAAVHSPETCRIIVEDNGVGFDEKDAERIFGLFHRLHGRNRFEGTGIGLAVCRKIAERHGGGIAAIGAPGRGATFTVTLPVRQSEKSNGG